MKFESFPVPSQKSPEEYEAEAQTILEDVFEGRKTPEQVVAQIAELNDPELKLALEKKVIEENMNLMQTYNPEATSQDVAEQHEKLDEIKRLQSGIEKLAA